VRDEARGGSDVDLGVGELVVAVPEDVCVSADVSTRAGQLNIAGNEADGIDAEIRPEAPATAVPRLNLTGEVDLGQLRVVNLDDVELDGHNSWRFHNFDDGEMRDAMDAACAPAPRPTQAGDSGAEASQHGGRGGEARP
jgi:hypothetical protein